jgi:UDP-N-acetylmuramate--alanine ligase
MKIHLIGIGGIGVSALAQYYLSKNHQVSGSDLAASEITEMLEAKGVKVIIGNSAENISDDINLVVHSPAVKESNLELAQAKEFGIKCMSYPEALGELTKEYFTIAVAGAHGKSTTTAMMALALTKAGFDPTVIVGTRVKEFSAQGGPASGWGSNFRAGSSKYLVIEACEYDSSFLYYSPKIIVVTNIDKEHLDYFKTFANVKKAFKDFIMRLPKDGFLVYDKNPSTKSKEAKNIKKILKVPGDHNVFNALNVLSVCRYLGIDDNVIYSSLAEFSGTWRRFEIIKIKPFIIISDYAHHPNEIMATLKAVREKYKKNKIWCIFQPHQHQRTYYLFKDFVKVFKSVKINNIIITDIYDVAGREVQKINRNVSSEKIVKKINKKSVKYFPIDQAEKYIKENIKRGEVLVVMGAGDIYRLIEKF